MPKMISLTFILCSSAVDVKKKEGNVTAASASAASGNSYYQQPPAATQGYDQQYAQPYQPPWGYQQPPAPYQHHPHAPWPQYPNYY